jgi:hypothetical protein
MHNVFGRANCDNPVARDSDRLGNRVFGINGDDWTIGEDKIGF